MKILSGIAIICPAIAMIISGFTDETSQTIMFGFLTIINIYFLMGDK